MGFPSEEERKSFCVGNIDELLAYVNVEPKGPELHLVEINNKEVLRIIRKLLKYNPKKRMTLTQLLDC